MNQEQNNFNPNSFNTQGNNGVSNNQPLNNQNFNNTFNQGMQQNMNYNQPMYNQQPIKPKKNKIVKILAIIGGVVVGFIVLFIAIFSIVSASSEKLVCKSDEGNITIMYNDKTITGYTAVGISYDLDGQKKYAEQVGTEAYIQEFSTWFRNNTSGTCTLQNK